MRAAAVPRPAATVAAIWGVSAGVLRTETYEVVSWLYGEAVVKVWGRSENIFDFSGDTGGGGTVVGGGSR